MSQGQPTETQSPINKLSQEIPKIEVRLITEQETEQEAETLLSKVLKYGLFSLIGVIIGAMLTGFFQIQLEKERRQTELILSIFEVSKYSPINQQDAGKLDVDSFAKNMKLLKEGNLLKPIPLWWWLPNENNKLQPNVEAMLGEAQKLLETSWTKTAQYEALGYQAVLDNKMDEAKTYFSKSFEKAYYKNYHSVEEMKKLLSQTKVQKDVICSILNESPDHKTSYSAGMPEDLKIKMTKDWSSKCPIKKPLLRELKY
jgi:hypothetical protein